MSEVANDGPAIHYRPNRRSKYLRLKISHEGNVVVSYPPLTSKRYIDSFVESHKEWIETETAKIKKQQATLSMTQRSILWFGKPLALRVQVKVKKAHVSFKDDQVIVTVPSEDHTIIRQELEKFLRKKASSYFSKRIVLLCDVVNRDAAKIRITDSRTRWGSCSSRTTISLNWRLAMAPKEISDYVIYHELAHLTHMNHSKEFYRLLESYYPKYKDAERYLKENHSLLHF